MPDITIQVTRADYPSLQIGDTAYYSNVTSTAGFNTSSSFTKIGLVKGINNATSLDDGTETTTLTCEIDTTTPVPTTSDFIFFSKDNKVNLTSLLGYFASVKFKNNSTSKAEMFSIGCEIAESSK
tara:strand:- start:8789 stop:9163 length:375 start_codon:yes stop_codon:yes gene_type:complete